MLYRRRSLPKFRRRRATTSEQLVAQSDELLTTAADHLQNALVVLGGLLKATGISFQTIRNADSLSGEFEDIVGDRDFGDNARFPLQSFTDEFTAAISAHDEAVELKYKAVELEEQEVRELETEEAEEFERSYFGR